MPSGGAVAFGFVLVGHRCSRPRLRLALAAATCGIAALLVDIYIYLY